MNAYALITLAGLLLAFGLDRAGDLLNLRALDPRRPPEFRDVYDPARYRRSQEYTRARTRFAVLAATVNLLLVLVFWFARGFNRVDQALRGLGLGPIGTGLLFIGLLAVARAVVAIPFDWWSTFVIEERFGFNRTTPRTFWTDRAKGLLLAAVLGGPLVAAALWLFERAGVHAWLWCWLATALFVVGVQYVAPTWIMPLFNRFTPLVEGELHDAILAYARSVGFPLEGVFLIDGSRRSTKANALFTGFGRWRRVALFDTLTQKLGTAEVVAVVAHEIGHYKRHHVLEGLLLAVLELGGMLFLLSRLLGRPGLFAAFFMQERSVYAGLVVAALPLAPLQRLLSIAVGARSRKNELEADAFAAATTRAGERLASALRHLTADSLSNLTPHPLNVALHYSHPPVLDRIHALGGGAACR